MNLHRALQQADQIDKKKDCAFKYCYNVQLFAAALLAYTLGKSAHRLLYLLLSDELFSGPGDQRYTPPLAVDRSC